MQRIFSFFILRTPDQIFIVREELHLEVVRWLADRKNKALIHIFLINKPIQ